MVGAAWMDSLTVAGTEHIDLWKEDTMVVSLAGPESQGGNFRSPCGSVPAP